MAYNVAVLEGPLAQLAEQVTLNHPATGSIPVRLMEAECAVAKPQPGQ